MKQYKGKTITAVLILCVLVIAYFWGGNYAGRDGSYRAGTFFGTVMPEDAQSPDLLPETAVTENLAKSPDDFCADSDPIIVDTADSTPETALTVKPTDGENQEPSKEVGVKSIPAESQDAAPEEIVYTCTLSVCCDTILDNMKYLDEEKWELVPEDGIIFSATEVAFHEGESVFNLLQREMKKNKIHMEFHNTPMYNSAYIWGINNLYEFDVGELSGWIYKVNDCFPNYGASRYQPEDGDVIEWIYTCDLGRDVGGYHAAGGE